MNSMKKISAVLILVVLFSAGFASSTLAMKKAELVEAIPSDGVITTGADWDYRVFGPGGAHFGRVRYSNIVLTRGFSVFSPGDEADTPQMNKAELIEAIASDAGLTKADARRALDAFVGATTKALRSGNRVALVGFGSFSISKRKARTGRNAQSAVNSGLELVRGTVKFKAGDRPFLPNVEYTTTEDIIKAIAGLDSSEPGEATGKGLNAVNVKLARQFMDSFTNVILRTLQTGVAVNIGEDFGTFSVVLSNAKIHETKNGKTFWTPPIGHVDHGKGIIKFKAGADLAKTVA